MLKVLCVINALASGGAETLVVEVMEWLAFHPEVNIKMDLCTLYPPSIPLQREWNWGRWYRFDARMRYDFSLVIKLAALIRSKKYDIVHVHLFPSLYIAAFASFFAPSAVYVFTEHGIRSRRRKKLLLPFEWAAHRRYKKIIAVGWEAAKAMSDWLGSTRDKVLVIPNGINVPRRVREGPRDLPLLCVGTLSFGKGQDVLLKAMRLLYEASPSSCPQLIVMGDGPARKAIERKISETGLTEKVILTGRRSRDQVLKMMERARILVVPSRWEGMPMVILEAMARGVAVIATNVGDIPRLVRPGVTGLLVPPDNPWALAAAIKELHGDPNKTIAMGKAGREVVKEHYSIASHVQHLARFYSSITKQ